MTVIDTGALLTPGARRVITAIREAGGRPVLVGGCVRDAILHPGAAAKDIDIEVYGLTEVARLGDALNATGRAELAGRSFGVFKVRAGGTDIDVSVPRRESSTGAGHREFEIVPDPDLDAATASARRDFTVNALMADPYTGAVTDCHGGLADLAAGVLRHTSAAFAEDPLRVLRAVQFAARFGFTLAPETAVMCRWLMPQAARLSAERIWGEFAKLARSGTHISGALEVLAQTGWAEFYPELADLRGVEQEPAWHPEGDVWTHTGLAADQAARLADEAGLDPDDRMVIVLAALCHDFGKAVTTACDVRTRKIIAHDHPKAGVPLARSFLHRIDAPRWVYYRVEALVREHMNCSTRPTWPAVRRMARRLVPSNMAELALVISADCKGRGDPDAEHPLLGRWLAMSGELRVTQAPARGILTGRHLIAAGMTPGPAFGPVLAAATEAQDAGEFADEAGALAWLAREQAGKGNGP